MSKKIIFITLLITLLVAGAVYAQGRPNNATPCDPQLNAYNNGGIGFINPQDGQQWNGQQRGRMNRGAGQNGTGFYASLPPAYDGELPQATIDLMIDGWLDEQQAYAAYEAIMSQFGEINPFANIQQAEAQHIAAWEFLFDRYDITVPDVPTFDFAEFATPQEACALGAEAETANFGLYDEMLTAFADYPDIYQVALSLRNASEFQHLPAFQNCAG